MAAATTPLVLAATDFSPRSAQVVKRALAVATTSGARVRLVSVCPTRPPNRFAHAEANENIPSEQTRGKRGLLGSLALRNRGLTEEMEKARLAALAAKSEGMLETALVSGVPAEAIAAEALVHKA